MPRRAAERKLYPFVERWLKRHFACFATITTSDLEHLARTGLPGLLVVPTTIGTTGWGVLEAFFGEKLLFARGPDEVLPTVAAGHLLSLKRGIH